MSRKGLLGLVFGMVLCFATASLATDIAPTDMDTIDFGSMTLVAGPLTDSLSQGQGDITTRVYLGDDGLYYYTVKIDPDKHLELLKTLFYVSGFTGTAGYSFDDVADAGAPSPYDEAFDVDRDVNDGTISWLTSDWDGDWWGVGEVIKFFYVSTNAPVIRDYQTGRPENCGGCPDARYAEGLGYAPAPEPTSLILMGSGLLALGVFGRRRK